MTIRFRTQDELLAVKRAAKEAGVGLNRFVTKAVLDAIPKKGEANETKS